MKTTALASLLAGAVMSVGVALPAFAQDKTAEQPKVDTHLQVAMEVVRQTNTLPPYEEQLKLIVVNAKKLADPPATECTKGNRYGN